jgi:hypothetical protein
MILSNQTLRDARGEELLGPAAQLDVHAQHLSLPLKPRIESASGTT